MIRTGVSAAYRRSARRAGLLAAALAVALFGRPAAAENVGGDFCSDPMRTCGAILQNDCLDRLGAGSVSVSTSAECRSQLAAYRGCVSRIASECGGGTGSGAVGQSGSGGDSNTRIYCQNRVDSCLQTVDQDYRDCRTDGGSSCRADCRDERDIARDRCNDSLRSCLATGDFRRVTFAFPACARGDVREAEIESPALPQPVAKGGGAPASATGAAGAICRNGAFYCFMFQPGPVGMPCSCSGNPALGVPPFQGMVSAQ